MWHVRAQVLIEIHIGVMILTRTTEVIPEATFRSCALVGSSADMIGKGLGGEIDEHGTIIRVNRVPTPEHSAQWLLTPRAARCSLDRLANSQLCYLSVGNEITLFMTLTFESLCRVVFLVSLLSA